MPSQNDKRATFAINKATFWISAAIMHKWTH